VLVVSEPGSSDLAALDHAGLYRFGYSVDGWYCCCGMGIGVGMGWTSEVWGFDGPSESMALCLRRRRQMARKARRAMIPRPSMAAPMPMPAFAPVLRPELPVIVPFTGATVALLELDD
jgi:hypothetical protein